MKTKDCGNCASCDNCMTRLPAEMVRLLEVSKGHPVLHGTVVKCSKMCLDHPPQLHPNGGRSKG